MGTIRLKTNQHRLIANLRHAFNQRSMLGELLQNARRAGASHISIVAVGNTLIVSDDGSGISDLQSLIFIAESGWDQDLQARENAFGLGVLSTLYFADHLSVHSGRKAFNAPTASIIRGDAIEEHVEAPRIGTEIRLDGVQSPQAGVGLPYWVNQQLKRLCEAFPVSVSFNGMQMPRPLAHPSLSWRETSVGRVLIDLQGSRSQWRCFLQGLPIGPMPTMSKHQIVLLRDDMIARPPDRQHLRDEEDEHPRIQAAINEAYRQTLTEAKARLAASEFVALYAETCLSSSNADLLNDMYFAPRAWFRDWEGDPPGYRQSWGRYALDGLNVDDALTERGVWRIETDGNDEPTAEIYLEARKANLLEENRLDGRHWLIRMVRTIEPNQVQVKHGAILHEEPNPPLADCTIGLTLVETLSIHLEGEPGEVAVPAVRKGDTLYLTPVANQVTRLVSDYIVDDRYSEDREDDDERTIDTFIAVGCSHDPGHVVSALLPDSLRHTPQSRLAGATVRLVFDAEGKLTSVST